MIFLRLHILKRGTVKIFPLPWIWRCRCHVSPSREFRGRDLQSIMVRALIYFRGRDLQSIMVRALIYFRGRDLQSIMVRALIYFTRSISILVWSWVRILPAERICSFTNLF